MNKLRLVDELSTEGKPQLLGSAVVPPEAGPERRVVMVEVRRCLVGTWSEATDELELLLELISIFTSSSSELSSVSTKAHFLYIPSCLGAGMAAGRAAGEGGVEGVRLDAIDTVGSVVSSCTPSVPSVDCS